jgi:hypothetical protein
MEAEEVGWEEMLQDLEEEFRREGEEGCCDMERRAI